MDKIDNREEYLPEMSMPEPPPEPVNDNLFSDEEPDEPQMPTMVVKPRVDTDTIFKKKKKVVAVVEEEKIIEPVEPVLDEELYDDEGGMTFNADDSSDEESGGANFIYSSGEDEPVEPVEPVVVVPKKRGRPKKPPPVYPEGTVLSKVTGKPKKVMSEKTKEALRLGRLKSLETRRAKKEKKESIGVIRDEVYPRDEVVETEGKKTQKPRPKSRRDDNSVSKKELQNMMLNTILGYEAQKTKMDKEAKIIRDKEEAETAKRNELNKTIQRALNPNDMDFYGDCFKFTQ